MAVSPILDDPQADFGLPGWTYRDPQFFEAEKRAFLRASPQIVCHSSDLAEPGAWQKLDYLGESIVVIRGDDGEARAFHNVCRHRGSQILDGESGCARVLTCPYHAWSYDRQGRLAGVPHRSDYPSLDAGSLGLKPVTLEEWRGMAGDFAVPSPGALQQMLALHLGMLDVDFDLIDAPELAEELRKLASRYTRATRR